MTGTVAFNIEEKVINFETNDILGNMTLGRKSKNTLSAVKEEDGEVDTPAQSRQRQQRENGEYSANVVRYQHQSAEKRLNIEANDVDDDVKEKDRDKEKEGSTQRMANIHLNIKSNTHFLDKANDEGLISPLNVDD